VKDIIDFRRSADAQEYLLQLGGTVSSRPQAEHGRHQETSGYDRTRTR
jgi:hypothetical protein